MSNNTKNQSGGFFLNIHIAQYLDRVRWSGSGIIHPSWFLFWNPTPGAVISCGEKTFEITPDYAYLVPPYTTISADSSCSFKHLYAHFDAAEPFDKAVNQIYKLDPEPARQFYLHKLNAPLHRRMLYWRIMLMEYLAMLPESAFSTANVVLDERLRKVLDHISNNWQHPADNRALARRAGMSVNNFYRRFQAELGISPQKYYMSMRLNAARSMLINEVVDIENIAQRCGFADRYCFSKAFKQFFGIAPGAFRRRELEKNRVEI